MISENIDKLIKNMDDFREEQDIREKLDAKSFDELVPSCPNCTCLESRKENLKNPDIVVKCLWYGWLKSSVEECCNHMMFDLSYGINKDEKGE